MNLQELVHRVSFEEIWPVLRQMSGWADDDMLYYRIGYDLAQVMEGRPSDKPIVISREENPHKGSYISAYDCEGNWLEHNLLREIRLDNGLQLSEAEIVAVILENTSYLTPRTAPYRKLLPNKYDNKLYEMDRRDILFCLHLSPHKYETAVSRGDRKSIIEASYRNFLRQNRAKRMRRHRRELLREKYERLGEVQECINDIVGAHCGVAERELQYLLEAKEIMSHNICSARCAENERVEYLLDMLQRYGSEKYKRCDSMIFLFTSDVASPLTDHERRLAEEFLDRLAPLKRASVLNEQIAGFGPYLNLHITGSYAR